MVRLERWARLNPIITAALGVSIAGNVGFGSKGLQRDQGDRIEQVSWKDKACRVGLLVVAGGDRIRKRDEAGPRSNVWRTMTKIKSWLVINE